MLKLKILLPIGLVLIVCVVFSNHQSQAIEKLTDAEIAGIIVGGPVTECADCSQPNCWGGGCSYFYDPVGGHMCKDLDGLWTTEMSNCNGSGFKSPFCHILTLKNCHWHQTFFKNPNASCFESTECEDFHTLNTETITQSYDECTETESNPHL